MDRKKQPLIRRLFQAAFFALTNGFIRGFAEGQIYKGSLKLLCVPGLNCYSCPGALGSCPIGSLQAVLDSGKFSFSTYVLGLLMAFGTLFGRLVCGWMCPFGLVQELLHKLPFPQKRKNLPGHRFLVFLKYLVLAVLVIVLPMAVKDRFGLGKPWFCAVLCPSGTLFAGIPLLVKNPAMRASLGSLFALKLGFLIVFLLLSVLTYRPFCKYVCPLGAFYSCFNRISLSRMQVDTEKCTRCGACQDACGMDVRVWESPNHTECIRCGACKAVCPHGALTSSFDKLRFKYINSTKKKEG